MKNKNFFYEAVEGRFNSVTQYCSYFLSLAPNFAGSNPAPRGGVTTIYAGTGSPTFRVAFFRAENEFFGYLF